MTLVPTIKLYYKGTQEVEDDYELKILKLEIDEATKVAVVYWNQPEKKNPMTADSLFELYFMLEYLTRHKGVHSVIWTGVADAFCSGMSASKSAFKGTIPMEYQLGYKNFNKGPMFDDKTMAMDVALKGLVLLFLRFPKFSISAVNGVAVGGGANFAFLLHDHVLCAQTARFRYPFIEIGLSPEVSCSYHLPRILGFVKSKELLFFGQWFSAEQALKMNLCNRVLPDADLLPEARKVAESLAKENQTSLRITKESLHKRYIDVLEAGGQMDMENENLLKAMGSEETQKSFAKFQQRHSGGKKSKAKL